MIRLARVDDDLLGVTLDTTVTGLGRAQEIIDIAVEESDCLVHLDERGTVDGFVITNRRAFFGRDFIKLVVVTPPRRRAGVGAELVDAARSRTTTDKVFISTNRSNDAMRALLIRDRWNLSGTLTGIDEGDPEMVFWKAGSTADEDFPH